MALWGGRFSQAPDEQFKYFNDSLRFDYRLALQDIDGSMAWAEAICSVGIITESEKVALIDALKQLRQEIEPNLSAILATPAEDIHSWVELQLIQRLGELGKKLHTGRSRNDQVAVDMKLWCRAQALSISHSIYQLQQQLVSVAEAHQSVVMPGYTHLQRAQPVTFGHWCLAYYEMLERDYSRLVDAYQRMNTCPLGSGALAGTAYPIDRDKLAQDLGFEMATRNSLDSVSDRDHVLELLAVASISMMHLSRFAEDLIIFNSGESRFVELSDKVTSGSSLMPQKKNPDACELVRGKTGRVFGALSGLLTTLKGLPLAYNKDMQEDKEGIFDALETWQACLNISTLVLDGIKVDTTCTKKAAEQGYANATELADYLVGKGIAFREAHHIVGQTVVYAISQQKALEQLSLNEFQLFHSAIKEDVYSILSLDSCLEKRSAKGGVSLARIAQAITEAKAHLQERDSKSLLVSSL